MLLLARTSSFRLCVEPLFSPTIVSSLRPMRSTVHWCSCPGAPSIFVVTFTALPLSRSPFRTSFSIRKRSASFSAIPSAGNAAAAAALLFVHASSTWGASPGFVPGFAERMKYRLARYCCPNTERRCSFWRWPIRVALRMMGRRSPLCETPPRHSHARSSPAAAARARCATSSALRFEGRRGSCGARWREKRSVIGRGSEYSSARAALKSALRYWRGPRRGCRRRGRRERRERARERGNERERERERAGDGAGVGMHRVVRERHGARGRTRERERQS